MSATPLPHLSPEEYLELERRAVERSEYHDGQVFALAGASERHNLIAGNIFASLHNELRGGKCKVNGCDMRVWIPRTRRFSYPDLSVVCGPRLFHDEHNDTLLNPVLLIEVLSPSTEAYDRGEKFQHYQSIETLREYVLVSQASNRIERYLRQAQSTWTYESIPSEATRLTLESVPCQLLFEEIYSGLESAGI